MMLQGPVSRKLAEMERSGALAAMIQPKPAAKVVDVRSRRWTAERLPLVVTVWKPKREEIVIDPRGAMAVTLDMIVGETAAEFGLTPADIRGRHGQKALAVPRHAAMYVAKQMTRLSYPLIGRLLGDRDHTTVLNGVQRAAELMKTDEDFARRVVAIMERVGDGRVIR